MPNRPFGGGLSLRALTRQIMGRSRPLGQMPQTFLRLPTVQARTGLSRTTIYEGMRREPPTFPKSISLGPRTTVWVEAEIDEWVSYRIRLARGLIEEGRENVRSDMPAVWSRWTDAYQHPKPKV